MNNQAELSSVESLPDREIAPGKEPFWRRNSTAFILLGIILVAAFFRFYGRDFDQGHNQHPDERYIVGKTLTVGWPSSSQEFWDVQHSPLNLRNVINGGPCPPPGCNYPYGALPVYLVKGAGWLYDTVVPHPQDESKDYYHASYDGITKTGRSLAAIFDLITILLVFLIGRRLYSSATGLIAAALVAFAVTHIQIAHFYASDVFLVTFMMGALYCSVVLMQRPSWRAALGAGLCIGLAVATKVSVVPFAVVVLMAIILRTAYRKRTRVLAAELGDPIGFRPAAQREREMSAASHFGRGLLYVLGAAVAAVIAFVICEPYVLLSFDFSVFSTGGLDGLMETSPFTRGIKEQAGIQSGQADVPYTRQYVGTVPLLYHLQQLVMWGLSPLPGLVTVAGFAVGIWRVLRGKPAELLIMAGAIPYFVTILVLEAKWMRYMLPLVPLFCLLGAAMLMRGWAWSKRRNASVGYLRNSRRGIVMVQRNLFPILTGLAIGGAFLWAVAFMNIYSQEHSRVQASEWFYDNVPVTMSFGGVERPTRISAESWDDQVPLGIAPQDGKPLREPGMYGAPVTFGMYDDRPPEQYLDYVKQLLSQTDYITIASNRLYGSLRHLPWRYPVANKFYDLLFAGKLGYQHLCSSGAAECAHTTQVTPELLGIKFNDQGADESFTVYDHPAVDFFKKTSTLTSEQLDVLFSSSVHRPAELYSTERHDKTTDDMSLAYDQPLSSFGELSDFNWNPLAQSDTQWIAIILWLILAEVLGLVALPIVLRITRHLPDRGYPLAKIIGLLLVAWGVWCLASAKLLPFTVWTIALVLLLLLGISALCWRLGGREIVREFFSTKRSLVIFYEVLFLAAFGAFIVIRMLNPDLWHPSLGGEKTMEFGFLNATLRSAWMPPADPFFSNGYINYYYYGQFVMAVLIKLLGVYPALGVNLSIPLLYAFAFTAGASIVYNIVAWAQHRRGSLHVVSRAGMVFGFVSGFLMLVTGNMHGPFQWIMINYPTFANTLIQWAHNLGFTEQSMVTPVSSFDFWGPSRIISHTINEFPYWSFLFADFHPHLIDMPFTLVVAGLAVNMAFAGPLLFAATRGTPIRSRVKASLEWLWGQGWSGALFFGVLAVMMGTLFATNSWDWPTFAAIVGGAAVVALLVASVRQPVTEEVGDVEIASPGTFDKVLLWVVGLVSVAALALGSLLAASPFLISFKNVLQLSVRPLVDGGPLEDAPGVLMHRTTLPEFVFFWALFVFIAVSYLLVRLWAFPWRAAASDVARVFTRRRTQSSPSTNRGPVFSPDAAFSLQPVRGPQLATAAAMSGNTSSIPSPNTFAFTSDPRDPVRDVTEPVHDSDDAAGEDTATGTMEPPLQTPMAPDIYQPVPDEAPVIITDGEETGAAGPGPSGNGTDSHLLAVEPSGDGGHMIDSGNGFANTVEYIPAVSDNWLAGPLVEPAPAAVEVIQREQPGVIPLWAGLGLLLATTALVILQLATGQYLLALLVALIGGIGATTLASTRSAPALFTGVLLIGALSVAMGVELVYLADHLRGGDMYRMNTVFKFYIQVWLLFGAGCAAAIYYIYYGVRDRRESRVARDEIVAAPEELFTPAEAEVPEGGFAAAPTMAVENGHETGTSSDPAMASTDVLSHDTADAVGPDAQPLQAAPNIPTTGPLSNWLVWSDEDTGKLADAIEPVAATEQSPVTAEPVPAPVVTTTRRIKVEDEQPSLHWTWGRIAWSVGFAVVLLASLVFAVYGTQDRVSAGKRFPNPPAFGTLDGLAFMQTAEYGPINSTGASGPVMIDLKYEYEAIKWLQDNVNGLHVIAEGPYEYYRDGGMNAAAYSGLPMVVGGLHQGEQRYDWLVGDRDGQIRQFYSTTDPQYALAVMSLFDIDYIYLGQLEKARAGDGLAKFEQLAKAGVLEKVFDSKTPEGITGATIYKVVRSPKQLTGAPVEGKGVAGISITPVPTSTPLPPPTPPTDNPELQKLIGAVAANPGDVDAHLTLVDWYRNNNFWQAAADELQTTIKLRPKDVALRHMLGDAYQSANQSEKALKAWEDAVQIEPDNPATYNKVGIGYTERKRYDDAIKAFQTAIAKDKTFVEAYYHLGEAYDSKGNRDEAKKAYQGAVDAAKAPDDPWAKAARERLAKFK